MLVLLKTLLISAEIIQGLVVAQKYGVDLSQVESKDLYQKILELGRVEEKV